MFEFIKKLLIKGKDVGFFAQKGLIAMNDKNYSSAVKNYTNAIILEDDNIEYYYQRAMAYNYLNSYENALKDLNIVHTLQANLGENISTFSGNEVYVPDHTRRKSIEIKRLLKDYDGAIEDVNILLNNDPDNIDNMDLKADIYKSKQDYESALSLINKILEKEPNNGHFYLFRCGLNKELNNLEQAKKDLQKALSLGLPSDDKEGAQKYTEEFNKQI